MCTYAYNILTIFLPCLQSVGRYKKGGTLDLNQDRVKLIKITYVVLISNLASFTKNSIVSRGCSRVAAIAVKSGIIL